MPSNPDLMASERMEGTFLHYVQWLVTEMLDHVRLEKRGRVLDVDEVRPPGHDRAQEAEDRSAHPLRMSDYTPIESVYREPRISFIKSTLENILDLCDLTDHGTVVDPDAFRLIDLERFRSDRGVKLKWNLGAMSSVCNLDCEFCYRYGSPKDGPAPVSVMIGRTLVTPKEVASRLEHFHDGAGLFEASADLGEDFVNPETLNIYRAIRRKDPHYKIDTTTHGGFLTEDVVAELATLKPLELCVSVNSADPEIRRRLMKDDHPEVAIRSVQLLESRGIHFGGSIVAWPTVPLSDVEKTVRYLDAHNPRYIRIQLPGHTRFHPTRVQYDRESTWAAIVALARRWQRECRSPLYWQPYLYGNDAIVPQITGTIPGSPAQEAGILPGDEIVEIDGRLVASRQKANALLARSGTDDDRRTLKIRRGMEEFRVDLRETADHRARYPYGGDGYSTLTGDFGIMVNSGLELQAIVQMVEGCLEESASRVLVLSSVLMESAVRDSVRRVLELKGRNDVNFDVISPEARYFGGNIIMGDLLTVSDCVEAVREYHASGKRIDRVCLPETMFDCGKDLVGVPHHRLEEEIGLPVRLIPHARILD